MKRYLVCFDISDDKLRLRAGKIILGYGDRVQESVFEIFVKNESARQTIVNQLQTLKDGESERDSDQADVFDIRFYLLCQRCREKSFSIQGEPIATSPATIII